MFLDSTRTFWRRGAMEIEEKDCVCIKREWKEDVCLDGFRKAKVFCRWLFSGVIYIDLEEDNNRKEVVVNADG